MAPSSPGGRYILRYMGEAGTRVWAAHWEAGRYGSPDSRPLPGEVSTKPAAHTHRDSQEISVLFALFQHRSCSSTCVGDIVFVAAA